MGHREKAESHLKQARFERWKYAPTYASMAAAHAALALLDYLQQQDENPDYSDAISIAVEDGYKARIAQLEKDLAGARAALRAHEAAAGNSMQQRAVEDADQL